MTEIHTLYDESGDTMSVSEIRGELMRANNCSVSTYNYEDDLLVSPCRSPKRFIRALPEIRLYAPILHSGICVVDTEPVFGDKWIEALKRMLRRHGFLEEQI